MSSRGSVGMWATARGRPATIGEVRTLQQPTAHDTATGPVLLTSREAAALLQVSVETLHAMPVPYLTIGSGRKRPRRRYLRETLVEWAKQQEVT